MEVLEIAVIGWGSLIWCPGNLRIKTKWRSDGPTLPIEYARISKDDRLTLVILPGADDQRTYWALSEFDNLDQARQNLRQREGAELSKIHYLVRSGQLFNAAQGVPKDAKKRMREWLATRRDIGAAIWTGLPTNWRQKRARDFTPEDALRYLKELESEKDRATASYDRAREYVRNTPSQIHTKVRGEMQQQGWQDNELPRVLFET